jgi:hypothetical protein
MTIVIGGVTTVHADFWRTTCRVRAEGLSGMVALGGNASQSSPVAERVMLMAPDGGDGAGDFLAARGSAALAPGPSGCGPVIAR